MEFRLVYNGELRPNGDPTHKQEIRKRFHPQLKQLWNLSPSLKGLVDPLPSGPFSDEYHIPRIAALPNRFSRNGYRFVPLVTRDLLLLCTIDVLFL